LATPAVAAGKVFIGGGFGSSEFYALDAQTGASAWTHRPRQEYHYDEIYGGSSPTAAVVDGEHVVFNTRFGEPVILTLDGKDLSRRGPMYVPSFNFLVSIPALVEGKVYASSTRAEEMYKPNAPRHLVCFDVAAGRELWKHKIAGDV